MAYKKIDGIIDTKLKVMKTTGAAGEDWNASGNYFQNDETGGLSLRTGAVGALQVLQVADPTATTDAATRDYVDTNAGSVATTEQVVTIDFDFTDYNTQVPNPNGTSQNAVMNATFTLPAGSYVSGCGAWIDSSNPWASTVQIIVGDATSPVPAGAPPPGADRWMHKTDSNPSAGGAYWKSNWDKLASVQTIYVCISASEANAMTVGVGQVFLKYVETPRT